MNLSEQTYLLILLWPIIPHRPHWTSSKRFLTAEESIPFLFPMGKSRRFDSLGSVTPSILKSFLRRKNYQAGKKGVHIIWTFVLKGIWFHSVPHLEKWLYVKVFSSNVSAWIQFLDCCIRRWNNTEQFGKTEDRLRGQ